MTEAEIDAIIARDVALEEADRRAEEAYNPLTGSGSPLPRRLAPLPPGVEEDGQSAVMLPEAMLADPLWRPEAMTEKDYVQLRFRYDFEYWAIRCVRVRLKGMARRGPLRLNPSQRRILAAAEECRAAGRPIRLILLKARQCGGSTFVQIYFAYIQIILRRNWNSVICGHVRNTAAIIRRIYRQTLDEYPPELYAGPEPLRLRSVAGSASMQELAGTGCTIDLGTSHAPDSLRGGDYSLAHLSETAFWSDTAGRSADDFIRTISGSVPLMPLTAIVMESTANGTGNLFHSTWLAAEAGTSAYTPLFIPWHEIRHHRMALTDSDRRALAASLTEGERALTEQGVMLSCIAWYRAKRGEYGSDRQMIAEFPGTPVEAFVSTDTGVFDRDDVERLRPGCFAPSERGTLAGCALTGPGAMRGLRFTPSPSGLLEIWERPAPDAFAGRYIVTVDIGGRADTSDWSVIAVTDRLAPSGHPEIVAQWRGHADHDIVCWQAAAIATFYATALLVVESNSLESGGVAAADDASLFILGELRRAYRNLYVRPAAPDTLREGYDRPGFHTNRRTKVAAISALIAAVRDGAYTERSSAALDELLTYQVDSRGAYAARPGYHDDMLMTRAITLYVISQTPQPSPPQPLPRTSLW